MRLPSAVREQFRRYGSAGGRARAARLTPAARKRVAREAAAARWIAERFGTSRFESLGLPGGELVDVGLADLAGGRTTVESLLVSLAAPRLRREGVPMGAAQRDPERRLYEQLERSDGDLAHARYNAYLRQIVSFADACRTVRKPRSRNAHKKTNRIRRSHTRLS